MILKITIGLVILYALLCAFAFLFGRRLAFPAPAASYKTSTIANLKFIEVQNGGKIAYAYLKNPSAKYTIFYSHGNGEDIGDIMPILINFFNAGYSVFAYDYFGYGLSSGKSDFSNLYECAEAAWRQLSKVEGVDGGDIAIFGYSMGSAPSTFLAAKHRPRALILLGGFASAFEAVLPVNILPWAPLNNAEFIKKAHCPVLIVHGSRDRIVPFRNGAKLFRSAASPKYFIKLDKAGHFDAYENYPEILPHAFFEFINNLKIENATLEEKGK